jgi:hypothetical protein
LFCKFGAPFAKKTASYLPYFSRGKKKTDPCSTINKNHLMMKKQLLLFAAVCMAMAGAFAQFSFVHISDMHISDIPFAESDTNAQYFRCYAKEFAGLLPKPAFVAVSGDVSNVGNLPPDGMYPTFTKYLFPPSLTNPGIGDYFIDSARTIPIYFVPGNHEY